LSGGREGKSRGGREKREEGGEKGKSHVVLGCWSGPGIRGGRVFVTGGEEREGEKKKVHGRSLAGGWFAAEKEKGGTKEKEGRTRSPRRRGGRGKGRGKKKNHFDSFFPRAVTACRRRRGKKKKKKKEPGLIPVPSPCPNPKLCREEKEREREKKKKEEPRGPGSSRTVNRCESLYNRHRATGTKKEGKGRKEGKCLVPFLFQNPLTKAQE